VLVQVTDTARLGQTSWPTLRTLQPVARPAPSKNGIGLAISKALIERMGGSLSVSSQPGLGTAFSINLPASGAAGRLATVDATPARPALDAARARRCAAACLHRGQPGQHDADGADPGPSAGERCTRPSTVRPACAGAQHRPDLVLLDMQLPDFDGHEVYRRLQATRPRPACADRGLGR
jgi:CheY-like chemotaxis protein